MRGSSERDAEATLKKNENAGRQRKYASLKVLIEEISIASFKTSINNINYVVRKMFA